ncbi:MAG: hypothetical protein IJ996_01475 [Clostridia bacterium]|nr:hypothetical protein [Clostridia bacterium]
MKINGRTADYQRVNEVIQADKSVISEGCKALVLQDLAEKLEEYFDLTGLPQMDVYFQNGTYYVSLNVQAERIKKFHVLK